VDGHGRVLWSQQVANDQAVIETPIAEATTSANEVRWTADLTSADALGEGRCADLGSPEDPAHFGAW
jgi:hypothetical protein